MSDGFPKRSARIALRLGVRTRSESARLEAAQAAAAVPVPEEAVEVVVPLNLDPPQPAPEVEEMEEEEALDLFDEAGPPVVIAPYAINDSNENVDDAEDTNECRDTVKPIMFTPNSLNLSGIYNHRLKALYVNQLFFMERKLGRGSFGEVYHAKCFDDGFHYAVKASHEAFKTNCINEIISFEKVSGHVNCLRFIRAWKEAHLFFIQMELCSTSLDKIIRYNFGLNELIYCEILTDVAKGLSYLHSKNLLHLDIKPGNIMISADGICKIGDFALVLDLEALRDTRKPSYLESEGDGKYVAPEVLDCHKYTLAADIYCFGLTMFELILSKVKPLKSDVWSKVREEILPDFYPQLYISQDFTDLLKSMIRFDYKLRPPIEDVLANTVCQNTVFDSIAVRIGFKKIILSTVIATENDPESYTNSVRTLWGTFGNCKCVKKGSASRAQFNRYTL